MNKKRFTFVRSEKANALLKASNKAFTVVELLVVISIIAILSVVGIVVFTNVQREASDAKRKSDINSISKAYEVKYVSSGTYQELTDDDFANGKIPTPYEGGSYFIIGPNSTEKTNQNYLICASLTIDEQCDFSSPTCYCLASHQGEPVNPFSAADNLISNGSFEVDSNSDGLADNWSTTGSPPTLESVSDSIEGNYAQRVKITNQAATIGQSFPHSVNTVYTLSAWIKVLAGDVTLSLAGDGHVSLCSVTATSSSWKKYTTSCNIGTNSDVSARVRLNNADTDMYIDAVQVN